MKVKAIKINKDRSEVQFYTHWGQLVGSMIVDKPVRRAVKYLEEIKEHCKDRERYCKLTLKCLRIEMVEDNWDKPIRICREKSEDKLISLSV